LSRECREIKKSESHTHSLRNQVQEVLPGVGTTKPAELSKVIVAGQAVVSVALNVNGTQVTSEWHTATEQEMFDFNIKIDVGQFFGLRGHAATEKIVIVARFDDDWTVKPVTETQ
jgi:ribosomal protein L11 methylase PrmA